MSGRMIFPFEEPEENGPIGCPMVVDFADGRRSVGELTGVGPVKYDGDDLVSYEVSYRQKYVVGELSGRTHGKSSVPALDMLRHWPFGGDFDGDVRVVHRASIGLRQPVSW